MKLLLVEDDLEIGTGVRSALQEHGLQLVWVRRLDDARRHLDDDAFDLVLLDLGLPDGDGLSLVAWLRRERRTTPVLILTARDGLEDRVKGLDGGADDYLVKPFALAELVSRVRALARRSFGMLDESLEVRDLRVHVATRRVTVGAEDVELSPSEYDLLCFLLRRVDRVVTRRVLEEQVLRSSADGTSNVLDVHVSNLRRKIGEGYVRTVRGVGYVIDRQPPRRREGR